MNNRLLTVCLATVAATAVLLTAAFGAVLGSKKDGLVEYAGAQKDIFKTGKASSALSLEDLAGRGSLYAVGPVDGLDGEITIFDSKAYITKVRGAQSAMDNTFKHGAIFLVWTEQAAWRDVPVPASVKGYVDLQNFVRAQAQAGGIDVSRPFPFLLTGAPVEIKWHINVDRTQGKPITKELFATSKAGYVTKNETVDIIGFYADGHPGEFISQYAPAIKEESGIKNAIHMHQVSQSGKEAGHIDDLVLGEGMVLRLPK